MIALAECIKKEHRKYWMASVLVIPALLISFLIVFMFFSIDGSEETNIGQNILASTRSDSNWNAILSQKITDDLITSCHHYERNGNENTLICERIAGEDIDVELKTFFKASGVKNYIVEEQRELDIDITCAKGNVSCNPTKIKSQQVNILSANKSGFDFNTAIRSYSAGESVNYTIKWIDDIPLRIKEENIQVNDNTFRQLFPSTRYYENEWSINPTGAYNYSVNNWAGDYSNTSLDSDDNITLYYNPLFLNFTNITNSVITYGSDASRITVGSLTFLIGGYDGEGTTDIVRGCDTERGYCLNYSQTTQTLLGGMAGYHENSTGKYISSFDREDNYFGLTNIITNVSTSDSDGLKSKVFDPAYCQFTDQNNVPEDMIYFTRGTENDTAFMTKNLTTGLEVNLTGIPSTIGDTCDIACYNTSNGQKQVWLAEFSGSAVYVYNVTGNGAGTWWSAENRTDTLSKHFIAHLNDDLYLFSSDGSTNKSYVRSLDNNGAGTGEGWIDTNLGTLTDVQAGGLVMTGAKSGGVRVRYSDGSYRLAIQALNSPSHFQTDVYLIEADPFSNLGYVSLGNFTSAGFCPDFTDVRFFNFTNVSWTAIDETTNINITAFGRVSETNLTGNWTTWTQLTNTSYIGGDFKRAKCIQVRFDFATNGSVDTPRLNAYEIDYDFSNLKPAPSVPHLHLPTNESNLTNMNQLNWSNSTDAQGDDIYYYLEVDTTPAFSSVDYVSNTISETANTTGATPTGLTDGGNYWRVRAYNSFINSSWSEVRYFTLDSTNPSVTLGNMTDLTTIILPVKSSINITASDTNLDSCWYYTSDSGINVSVTCNDTSYTDISWTTEGSKIIYGCANDTFGRTACDSGSVTIDYYTTTQSSTPSSSVSEGGLVKFNLTISKTGLENQFDLTSAVLLLNNTQYSSSKTSFVNGSQFITSIYIPDGWGNVTGITQNWNWSFAIYNSTSIFVNTTTALQNLVVYDAGIDDCSSYGNKILQFNLYDEEDKTYADVNITIETTATLTNQVNSTAFFNYSQTTNESHLSVCVSDNSLNYTDFNLSTITRYEFQDHEIEYHYIDNYNQSGYTFQNISLYDLATADSTSFLITYNDEYYLPTESAVIDVLRYYVADGVYRSVEHGRTNDQGETRAHLVTEDVKYIFKVRKGGVLLYTSPEYLAICQATPCQINLRTASGIITYEDFGEVDNLEYTLSTDKANRKVTLSFSTLDGSASTMKMNVTRSNQMYNDTACEETLVSSGGTLTCNLGVGLTNTTYDIWVWKDSEFVTFDSFSLVPDAIDTFGQTGMVLAVMIIITLPLMAITSGIAMVILLFVGVIMAGLLALMTGGSIIGVGSTIIWLVCAGVILIVKMSKRRYA